MIFTDRTIIVQKGTSSINDTIILYRGDKGVEIRFTLNEGSPFRFGSGASPNIIEKTEAAYGQLIIKRPNDLLAVFSEIAPTNEGKIVFTITAEMIDEITEVGNYTFQIRLLDESRNSRATLPEVVNGIEIREPIASEDVSDTNEVEVAAVGYALTTAASPEDAFDSQGNYNKTNWQTGDRITAAKLNKIEAGIDGVNKKVASGGTGSNNAGDISIADTGNYFTSTNVEGALQEAGSQIKDITNKVDSGNIGNNVEPELMDMPKVFIYGTALPTTKDNVNLTMDYISNTDRFSSYIKLKCQGSSSMSYAKKNFTVNMYSDEARETKLKKNFKGWGAQSKFCLKANYVDTTHTRNLSGARIAYDMVASRPDSAFKQQLLTAPRNGVVDGFPIKVYFNGEFYGIYTWNIPKDGWMFNMDKSNPNHMVLCAEQNNNGSTVNDNVLRCEFRKEWDGSDGNSWSIEFGTYSDALKNSFNRCVNFVMTATDEEFKTNIGNYFDLYSLLDYYCFTYFVAHIDGLGKNMLMTTYDGVIWGLTLYDMDSIYGAHVNGASFKDANIQCPKQYQETNSLLWQRIESCFSAELYARYLELRRGALSLGNIIKHVEEIYDIIPDRVFADEKAKWTGLPQVANNTMTRFRNYMRDRAVYVDAQMEEIGNPPIKIPCAGISLSANTLSFTTTDAQNLTATVEPSNTTDVLTWSVSPIGVVTVNNGVVTPIANGNCTITATCGSKSATCNVTVSGIGEDAGNTEETRTVTLNKGYGFDTSNGQYKTGTDKDYGASEEYVRLVIGKEYVISGETGFQWLTILGYNSDKTFRKAISMGTSVSNNSYTYIASCEYIRVGAKNSNTITITCVPDKEPIVEGTLLCYYDSADLTTNSAVWTDKTGNGRDLTINKNSEASLDITDQGLLFYNVYCRTSELNILLTGNFTVEYELTRVDRVIDVASYAFNSVVNATCKYCDSISNTNVYRVNGYNGDTLTNLSLTQDQMYKIRVIYGNEITLYADDVLVGTYTRNAFDANDTYQLCLGTSAAANTTASLNSRIKSFKLWNGIVEPTNEPINPNLAL